ncbi:MAG: threonine/homoserine/homoserine lactone efflux protein [Limimaricola cinnabarinus]|jgi:threonine/homoserine/homoserine lactone efflux protein|uniref:LysE family translocator n=1 Tax=Limimaricola cinnabarinus TaxID=1125964 RepID=UPI0039E3A146
MIDPLVLLAFVPAALALNLTPGADMMFCLGQGLRGGPRAALAADAGIAVAVLGHVTLAGLGLGAAVTAMPWLFDAIRWIGVAYLGWLAFATLRGGHAAQQDLGTMHPSRVFRQGFVVNLTNPKVILFVLAFLPQFTDAARPVLPQFLALGAVLSLGGLIVNGAVGVFAGGVGRRLAGSAAFNRWLGRVSASIFAGLALRLALLNKA